MSKAFTTKETDGDEDEDLEDSAPALPAGTKNLYDRRRVRGAPAARNSCDLHPCRAAENRRGCVLGGWQW